MNIGLGVIILGGLGMMACLVIKWVRLDNERIREREAWKDRPQWNWD